MSCVRTLNCKRAVDTQLDEEKARTMTMIKEVAGIQKQDKKKYNMFI